MQLLVTHCLRLGTTRFDINIPIEVPEETEKV